ncbi:M48 family metalloprotease [Streptomyces cirratus]
MRRSAAGRAGEISPAVNLPDYFLTCTAEFERTKAPWALAGVASLLALAGCSTGRTHTCTYAGTTWSPSPRKQTPKTPPSYATCTNWSPRPACTAARFFLRRSSSSVTAHAFGRAGWYAVVLDAGLVTRFRADPARLRALVLHELAHLRNRDTGIECLTRSLTWAFLPLGVLPLAAAALIGTAPGDALGVGLRAAVLLGLVFLSSRAVLRAREHGADVRAASWDGVREDLLTAIAAAGDIPHPWWKRSLGFHPTTEQRRRIVHHPDRLFRTGFWECFAAGLAAMSAGSGFLILWWLTAHEADPLNSRWAAALVISPAVVAVVGLGAWRTAARSDHRIRDRVFPALGLAVGLVLGRPLAVDSGMAAPLPRLASSGAAAAALWALCLAFVLVLFEWWAAQAAAAWGAPVAPRRAGWALGWVAASLILSVVIASWMVLTDAADWLGTVAEGVRADHEAVAQVAPAGPYWLWSAVHHPMQLRFAQWTPLILALVLVWAVPLAARLRPAPRSAKTRGSAAQRRAEALSGWPLVVAVASTAATAAFVGGTLVSRLLIHSGIPERTRTMDGFLLAFTHGNFVVAMLVQGFVALATAALLVRRHGITAALYGLMAAFVTGCLVTAVFFGGVLAAGCVDALALRPAACGGISLPLVRNTLLRILVGGTACSLIMVTTGAVVLGVRRRLRSEAPSRPVVGAAAEGRITARRVGLTALLLAGSVTLFACTTDTTDRSFGVPTGGGEEVRSACRQYDELLGSLDTLTTAEVHTRLGKASQSAVQGGDPALALAFMEHFKAALEGDSAAFKEHGDRINQTCAAAGVVLVNLP